MTPDRTGQAQVVVIASTGTAGTGAVHACLAEPGVSEVHAVTRRPLGVSHDKLKEVLWSDFADLGGLAQQLEGVTCCLFCLRTSGRRRVPRDPRHLRPGCRPRAAR